MLRVTLILWRVAVTVVAVTVCSFTIPFDVSVLPSVRMKQIVSHWTDFHEI